MKSSGTKNAAIGTLRGPESVTVSSCTASRALTEAVIRSITASGDAEAARVATPNATTPDRSLRGSEEPHWILVEFRKPPLYRNVLLAFEDHWNQVVGFYCGKDKSGKVDRWYETSAETHNSEFKTQPKWWMSIPQVPHYGG